MQLKPFIGILALGLAGIALAGAPRIAPAPAVVAGPGATWADVREGLRTPGIATLATALERLREQKSYSWEMINGDPGPVAQKIETKRGNVTLVQQNISPHIVGRVDLGRAPLGVAINRASQASAAAGSLRFSAINDSVI